MRIAALVGTIAIAALAGQLKQNVEILKEGPMRADKVRTACMSSAARSCRACAGARRVRRATG